MSLSKNKSASQTSTCSGFIICFSNFKKPSHIRLSLKANPHKPSSPPPPPPKKNIRSGRFTADLFFERRSQRIYDVLELFLGFINTRFSSDVTFSGG
ncbi:hypothetical protein HanIR_Chr11g0511481 [Helianthus annuus]|nr:hypothetical protein HanIR_Chr11g0511481 [Helianthus annuus]